ncbi:DUF4232 domain-containing protein [Streptomyces griseomycini]|uniref:DUF4232 domain-containing protein n=1 Tax=Streptomyces griseomycini TaxID=66895 RepID=A0A7W7VAT5_9ACTN|nr:DUF4232 domain-containing protein [Streptomyces griseomycini]MBB4903403.1 hypothetical protein [Streptomyces griseomycini]GGR55791.1 hypothetical protein GCM10015536_71210 [Streptomyces griseomycini]
MRVNKITIAALAVVAGLSLTACQNDDDATGRSDPPAASTPSSSNGGSGSGGSDRGAGKDSGAKDSGAGEGTSAGTGSDEGGEIGKCRTDELEVTATDATVGGDTDGTVAVEFTNGGGRDCAISGYAGVDLKTDSGTLSAERTGEQSPSVVLEDGESVSFAVTYPVNDSGGSGVRVTGLVVTPPDETKSVTLDWPGAASLPVTDGSGTPVRVGPIGSAGQGG